MRIIMHAILFFRLGRSPVSMCRMQVTPVVIFDPAIIRLNKKKGAEAPLMYIQVVLIPLAAC